MPPLPFWRADEGEIPMTKLKRGLLACVAVLALSVSASAGPVGDFEDALRSAYADYRSALFLTNAGKRDAAVDAITAFEQKWTALEKGAAGPPPQYADDSQYGETFTKVAAIAEKAARQASAGQLGEAHATLEAIREEIGGLHERSGIIGFSDRMNAYHAMMEHVLQTYGGAVSAGQLGDLREDSAVLAYLAHDIEAHPPADAASNAEFKQLLDAMLNSVAAVQAAARSGNPSAVEPALGALKAPYSKLFLKFG
jgi:hypothetical protein